MAYVDSTRYMFWNAYIYTKDLENNAKEVSGNFIKEIIDDTHGFYRSIKTTLRELEYGKFLIS